MLGNAGDFAIREQLASVTLSDDEQLHGFAQGHLAIEKGDVFLTPGFVKLCLYGIERNLLRELLETFFVELDSVHIVTDQKFVQLLGGSPFHGVQELKHRKVRFLAGK